MKHISLIGSTGSIGKNALEVISKHPHEFSIVSLAAKNNVSELLHQIEQYCPSDVVIFDASKREELTHKLKDLNLSSIHVHHGMDGLLHIIRDSRVNTVLLALTGSEGLIPLIEAIKSRKNIALANKEPLVMAGDIIRNLAKEHGVEVIPIDSEHSGIFQCLNGKPANQISRIFLTASGGPFLDRNLSTFDQIRPDEAVQHPKWNMGKKISVDSATLMNKGLEVIEASALFGFDIDRIEVLIHPEAIVHAIIEFVDGSQIAQMSVTDMKLPIQFALSYPKRLPIEGHKLNLPKVGELKFRHADMEKFPCLKLAFQAGKLGGDAPCVLNAVNETCVSAFLDGEILFTDIPKYISKILSEHKLLKHPNLEDIFKTDQWARNRCLELIQSKVGVRS